MKTAILLAAVMLGATACIVENDPAESKFITMSGGRQLDSLKLLMQKVHEPQWKIGYRYGANCKPEERQNGKELKEAMTLALRTWLEPLKKLDTERPIVDKFVYVLQPDFHFVQYGDTYNRDNPDEDLKAWREVDLRVNFVCMTSASGRFVGGYAGVGDRLPPAIVILDGTKLTPWMISVISHEFGHAFGLSDTYRTDRLPSEGGLDLTAGTQPASAMSGLYESRKAHSITEDDARGIIWVYNYLYKGLTTKNCFFADYVYVKIQGRLGSCAPKYPLIFETKYNPYGVALQILKDDPSIDINAQDASGMTALHYAVLYNKMEVVKALLAHKDIKPLLRNKDGDTPYDIALATGHEEFLKMLPAPARRKEDVNDDGVVNILDLVAVAAQFGKKVGGGGEVTAVEAELNKVYDLLGNADVNGDGSVDILDLVLVASAFGTTGTTASAPALQTQANLTAATVASWLSAAQRITPQAHYARGLIQLQQLHRHLSSAQTALLTNFGCARVCSSARTQQASLPVLSPQTNFPNPFRSETWLPYRLSKAAQVSIQIYSQQGQLVRTLTLGHKPVGIYQDKSSAAYWDGRNMQGESVASGVYFYTLQTGNFTATRKMVLRR